MQLASKMRFISAQFEGLLENDLWIENGRHANAMAQLLLEARSPPPERGSSIPCRPTPSSPASLPAAVIERLHEQYPFYVWDEEAGVVRWMCSWQTTPTDVDGLVTALREATAG